MNEIMCISIDISLNYVHKGHIYNIPSSVQITACRRPGDKALFEAMMVSLMTHICVIRPQWVNTWASCWCYCVIIYNSRRFHNGWDLRPDPVLLSGVPDYFYRNKISSGGDLSHYSSASLY